MVRHLLKESPSALSDIAWRGMHSASEKLHHCSPVRLAVVAASRHENFALQTEQHAGIAQSSAPLPRTCLGCKFLHTFFGCVIYLRNRGIRLVRAAGVQILPFVVYFCLGSKVFLQ